MADVGSVYKDQYETAAKSAAASFGIPEQIFLSLVQQESGWNPNALGTAGEWGFTQLKQGAADEVNANRYDPISNLKGGAAYLAKQFKATGSWSEALRAYNQGYTGAQRDPNAGKQYASEVLTRAQSMGYDGKNATTPTDDVPFVVDPSQIMGQSFGQAWDMVRKALGYSPPAALAVGAATGENIPLAAGVAEWFTSSIVYILAFAIIIALAWSSMQSLFQMGATQ